MRQTLKPLHEVMERDKRNWSFVVKSSETGEERPYTLEDLHNDIQGIQLVDGVPVTVREQFDIVLNLLLYSWFVYDFSSSAFMLSNATVEMALTYRYEKGNRVKSKRSPGLRNCSEELSISAGLWMVISRT